MTLTFQSVLPVELMSFMAKAIDNNAVQLDWVTASEENNLGFEIERSVNGVDFVSNKNAVSWEKIGFTEGNGTTLEASNYNFIDESPNEGTSYYRLKQFDFDGQFEYSKVVEVELGINNEELQVYPNPVQDKLMMTNTENVESIVIHNLLGQPIRQFAFDNELFSIDVSELPKGQYILSVQKTNGIIVTKRFMK